jgi:Tfp pilus assembly protein PilX
MSSNMKRSLQKKEKGFAMLLALIISSVVLAIGVSILEISVSQINLSATARESEFAFQSAHAGIDCMWYWRTAQATAYTTVTTAVSNPAVTCFGVSPSPSSKIASNGAGGTANIATYLNTFEWGTPERCTEVTMHVIDARTTQVVQQFTNEAIGTDGLKTCNQGNICTVLVSSGYNRPCDELTTSIFTVQREITLEF